MINRLELEEARREEMRWLTDWFTSEAKRTRLVSFSLYLCAASSTSTWSKVVEDVQTRTASPETGEAGQVAKVIALFGDDFFLWQRYLQTCFYDSHRETQYPEEFPAPKSLQANFLILLSPYSCTVRCEEKEGQTTTRKPSWPALCTNEASLYNIVKQKEKKISRESLINSF